MTVSSDDPALVTSIGVGAIAMLGAVAKGAQWRDAKTGEISIAALISGIALSLVMAAVVRAAGVHYGWEPWVQCALSGIFCYVGPDPILRALAGMALKRFGVSADENKRDDAKP